MQVLKDKQTRNEDALSRYNQLPFYYNVIDDKYMYGLAKHLSEGTQYTTHNVQQYDTPESLAQYYYGRPDYYWIILDFNRILNPFINLYKSMSTIKIPSLSYIYFEGNR